jgi:hypothetical protein
MSLQTNFPKVELSSYSKREFDFMYLFSASRFFCGPAFKPDSLGAVHAKPQLAPALPQALLSVVPLLANVYAGSNAFGGAPATLPCK